MTEEDCSQNLNKTIAVLAQEYTVYYSKFKELSDRKKEVEETLKDMLENNSIKNLEFDKYKINFSATKRTSNPRLDDVLSLVREELTSKLGISETEEIMDRVRQKMEDLKKVSTVRSLRISEI